MTSATAPATATPTAPAGFRCRASGDPHVIPVLSLGETPLANATS